VKIALRALALALAALLVLLLSRTFSRRPAPASHGVPARDALDQGLIAEHLAQAIRFQTVSHQDPQADDRNTFAALRDFLQASYPRVHEAFRRELIGGDGLLYQWRGSDRALAPILFLAHQDVVPVESATEAEWTHPPFSGAIAGGFVWGRGALDDKGPLICLFEAFESLLAVGFAPARSIWFASGFDEEVGGGHGAKQISRSLQERGLRFAWVLDEGGAIMEGLVPNVARPVAGIAIGEKGYLSLELLAHAEGGHSSMPPPQSAIHILAGALTRLQQQPFPARLTPTLRDTMEQLAGEMPLLPRLVTANLWLTAPLVVRHLAGRKETSPLVRTTLAPTILEAGVKENVVPSLARAVVNLRLLPGDSVAQARARVRDVIADERVELRTLERTVSEAAPLSDTRGAGYLLVAQVLRELIPDVLVAPAVVNGATDARHFQPLAKDVYRFTPRVLRKSDLKGVHGIDERAEVVQLTRMVRGYREIIRRAAQ
jgi:carboxypeptidase PM20D1